MSAAGESAVATAAREILSEDPGSAGVAFYTRGWGGPKTIALADGRNATVVHSESVLEIRERLAGAGPDEQLVILTSLPEHELGDDVLYRLASRRVRRLGEWEPIMSMFAARTMDQRLTKVKHLSELLQREMPQTGYSKAPNGVLTEAHAWDQFIGAVFGTAPSTLAGLIGTLSDTLVATKLKELPSNIADLLVARITERVGPGAEPALSLVLNGDHFDLVPLGLLSRVVYSGAESEPDLAAARGWLQAKWSNKPTDASGLALAAAAEENHNSAALDLRKSWQQRVAQLLDEAGIESAAWRSDVIVPGFDQRIERATSVISEPPSEEAVSFGITELNRARRHQLAETKRGQVRVRNLEMGLRCWIFLGTDEETLASFEQAAIQHLEEGGWLDLAVESLREAEESLAPVAETYERLVREVDLRRTSRAKQFGKLLASATAAGAYGSCLGVEEAIPKIVAPLAASQRVFFLVLDGLSEAALRSLLPDIQKEGWFEIGPGGRRRPPVAAMLPSVTDVSRASLLTGKRETGGQLVERDGFEAALSTFGEVSLFHKAELADHFEEVRKAIAGSKRVVGAVVNAIDDLLSDGDQVRLTWSLDSIAYVRALLAAAADSDRTVVVAGDHGHVLEHGSELRSDDSGGSRWRTSASSPTDGEVVVKGSRVMKNDGEVILPTTELLRYRTKAAGYHGGATPQEVITPLITLARAGSVVEGWEACAGPEPAWWLLDVKVEMEEKQKDPPSPKSKFSKRPEGQGALFEPPDAGATHEDEGYPEWIDRLMGSEAFKAEEERAPRLPDRAHLIGVLSALDRNQYVVSESVAATEIGVSVHRMASVVASIRPLINLEGFNILSHDRSTGEIRLDRELLDKQFSL